MFCLLLHKFDRFNPVTEQTEVTQMHWVGRTSYSPQKQVTGAFLGPEQQRNQIKIIEANLTLGDRKGIRFQCSRHNPIDVVVKTRSVVFITFTDTPKFIYVKPRFYYEVKI